MTDTIAANSRIERSPTHGTAWRCTTITRLTREETGKAHVFFVSAQVDGYEIKDGSVKVQYGWEGMKEEDKTNPVPLGKRESDYVEIPAAPGTLCWLTIDDGGQFTSDTVHDLHCEAEECGYFVRFQLLRYRAMTDPPTVPSDPTAVSDLLARVDRIEQYLQLPPPTTPRT